MNDRYVGLYTLGESRRCNDCGSIVWSTEVHDDFHNQRERIYVDAAISALWSTDYKFVPNTDALCDGDALIFIRDAVAAIEALRGKQ